MELKAPKVIIMDESGFPIGEAYWCSCLPELTCLACEEKKGHDEAYDAIMALETLCG